MKLNKFYGIHDLDKEVEFKRHTKNLGSLNCVCKFCKRYNDR